MGTKYSYFFNSIPNLPDFTRRLCEKLGQGRMVLNIIPIAKTNQYDEDKLFTWKFLQSPAAKNLPPWIPVVRYCVGPADKSKFRKAKLFFYGMALYFGWEIEPPLDIGCPLCGHGKVLNPKATIDDKSVISWDFGFSNTGRFVVHIDRYEEILENKLTGFNPQPLDCLYPDHYVLSFWRAELEIAQRIVEPYKHLLPSDVIFTDNGQSLIYLMPRELYNNQGFKTFHKQLMILHDQEEIFYQLIPPARQVGDLPKCRWVGLDIYGKAGNETEFNSYLEKAQCPACGKGGWQPAGQLVLDHSQWDGSDISKTEVGRIILSKKAYQLFCKKWDKDSEPIADYRDAIKIQ